jgi:hypothetical protein
MLVFSLALFTYLEVLSVLSKILFTFLEALFIFSLLSSLVTSLLHRVSSRICQGFWIEFFKVRSSFLRQILLDTHATSVFPVVFHLCQHQSCLHQTSSHWSVTCMRLRVDLTHWRVLYTLRVDSPPPLMLPLVSSSAIFHCCNRPHVVVLSPLVIFIGSWSSRAGKWFSPAATLFPTPPRQMSMFCSLFLFVLCNFFRGY